MMANLVGFSARTGKRVKQTIKRTIAAALSPPNINSLSQRLTRRGCQRVSRDPLEMCCGAIESGHEQDHAAGQRRCTLTSKPSFLQQHADYQHHIFHA